jgi:hypothetical protein
LYFSLVACDPVRRPDSPGGSTLNRDRYWRCADSSQMLNCGCLGPSAAAVPGTVYQAFGAA